MLGWRVFTLPSIISGKPVTSEMGVTSIPSSRSFASVPPVEMISIPISFSSFARPMIPALLETLSSALSILAIDYPSSIRTCLPSTRTLSSQKKRMACGYILYSTAWIRLCSVSWSSPGSTGTASCNIIGPVSRPSSTK